MAAYAIGGRNQLIAEEIEIAGFLYRGLGDRPRETWQENTDRERLEVLKFAYRPLQSHTRLTG